MKEKAKSFKQKSINNLARNKEIKESSKELLTAASQLYPAIVVKLK